MGAAESRADVAVVEIEGDLEDDGRDVGFAPPFTTPEQVEAGEAAAAAAAALHLSPPTAPEPQSFTVKEGDSSPVAATLQEYRLEKKVLGEGTFGKVRLATSESSGHQVAVKIIKRNKINARAEELLQREVRNMGLLRHANIARLYTWIKGQHKYYLVMEFCGGAHRRRLLRLCSPLTRTGGRVQPETCSSI